MFIKYFILYFILFLLIYAYATKYQPSLPVKLLMLYFSSYAVYTFVVI